MSERTRQAYERWAPSYDSDPNPQTALEEPAVLALLGVEGGMDMLDAACGTGRYTRLLSAAGAHVVGLDFSSAMLARARVNDARCAWILADLSFPLPLQSESFDRVNCAQALKHLPDLAVPLHEFGRVLRCGGILVFSVTHPDMTWDDYEMRETPGFILSAEADVHHHRLEDYTMAIAAAGLRLDEIVSVPVSERIREYLTQDSFRAVRGRHQVAVFRAVKS